MLRDEAITLMQLQLGFRTDQVTNLITALKTAQIKLERDAIKPWFLLSDEVTFTTTADATFRSELPADFIMESEDHKLTYYPDDTELDPVSLKKIAFDWGKEYYKYSEGPPEAYALAGNYFYIFPIPDDVYTIKWQYFAQDMVLDTNIENNWLKYISYYLMGEAGLLIATPLRNAAAIQQFTQWRTEGKIQLYRENEARAYANMPMQIGGPE